MGSTRRAVWISARRVGFCVGSGPPALLCGAGAAPTLDQNEVDDGGVCWSPRGARFGLSATKSSFRAVGYQ